MTPTPAIVCKAPKKERAKVEALRRSYLDDALYTYADKAFGAPTRCVGHQGRSDFDSKLVFTYADGSTLTFERFQPEGGERMLVSAKPIADVAAALKLLKSDQANSTIDWTTHEDQKDDKDPTIVTQAFSDPDANFRAMLRYRGRDLVGFGDLFNL